MRDTDAPPHPTTSHSTAPQPSAAPSLTPTSLPPLSPLQLLFLLGITLLIGFKKTLIFFKRPTKLRGTFCFLGGITLVLLGWPMVGMIVEVFGILNLFGNFFPIILSLLRNMPIIGPVLNHPITQKVTHRLEGWTREDGGE